MAAVCVAVSAVCGALQVWSQRRHWQARTGARDGVSSSLDHRRGYWFPWAGGAESWSLVELISRETSPQAGQGGVMRRTQTVSGASRPWLGVSWTGSSSPKKTRRAGRVEYSGRSTSGEKSLRQLILEPPWKGGGFGDESPPVGEQTSASCRKLPHAVGERDTRSGSGSQPCVSRNRIEACDPAVTQIAWILTGGGIGRLGCARGVLCKGA